MSDITFVLNLFLSLAALVCAYAFLMSIFKKEHNTIWLRGEAVCTLFFSGVAFGISYTSLFSDEPLAFIAVLALLLGLFNALVIVILHRKHMKKNEAEYPETLVMTSKFLGVATFTALVLHMLFKVASFAWG